MDTGNCEEIKQTIIHLMQHTQMFDSLDEILENWRDMRTSSFDDHEEMEGQIKTIFCAFYTQENEEKKVAMELYFTAHYIGPGYLDGPEIDQFINKESLRTNLPIVIEKLKLEKTILPFKNSITASPKSNKI